MSHLRPRIERPHRVDMWMRSCALTIASLFMTLSSSATEVQNATPEAIAFFEQQIRPLLIDHCYECHADGEANGGLLVDSRAALLRGGDTRAAIVPGDPQSSLLVEAIRYTNHDLQMPPQNRLSANEIAAIERWITMGVPDPRQESGDATAPPPTGMSIEAGREFWSMQPVRKANVPQVNNTGWVQTSIDAFVLAALEQNELRPAPPADRRTWIRRVTFDMTGLPPTSLEIEAFLSDDSPRAIDKVIERLLASEQYGVRWGRHWLDVARYADSNGLDENLAYGNAWRYRDYVVDAFNHDLPYDQFVKEQLSGDLLPGADERTKTATGFLALGAKVLAEPDREKLAMDTIDEQLDATGKALLGMTIGCARCHDHKFDPITQSDYYALAAIFKSTRTFADSNTGAIKHWFEHEFATADDKESLKEVDAKIAALNSLASQYKNQAMAKIRSDARAKATEYLVAATFIDLSMSLGEVASIAERYGLHPRILHHCRRHLHFNADHPFFSPWHTLAQQATNADEHAAGVDKHYRPLLATESNEPTGEAKAALDDASGFLAVPPKPEFALDDATLAEYDRLMEEARLFESQAPDPRAAMGVSDGEIAASIPLHIRGSHRNLGNPVARSFPTVMRDEATPPTFTNITSGRREMADWITSPTHPLTARVYVNRVWRWHFGRGIVASADNFGVLGDRPSHPELLDWLASEFVRSGWSTKHLHRLILSSSTYQMDSRRDDLTEMEADRYRRIDPENRLLSSFPVVRLAAEQIHDAILATSGRLDKSLDGKTVPLRNRQFVFNHTSVDHTRYDSLRRAVYLPVIRNNLFTTFEQFNFPDPTMPTGDRDATVVAPQALLMMNAEMVIESAESLAEQLLSIAESDASRVERAYSIVLSRMPSERESRVAVQFLDDVHTDQTANVGGAANRTENVSELEAWTLLCQSLMACNEFIYLR